MHAVDEQIIWKLKNIFIACVRVQIYKNIIQNYGCIEIFIILLM